MSASSGTNAVESPGGKLSLAEIEAKILEFKKKGPIAFRFLERPVSGSFLFFGFTPGYLPAWIHGFGEKKAVKVRNTYDITKLIIYDRPFLRL